MATPKPAPKFVSTAVPGHGLRNEGDSFNADGTRTSHIAGKGYAFCSCGTMSAELTSNYQRKAWHRLHKTNVTERTTS